MKKTKREESEVGKRTAKTNRLRRFLVGGLVALGVFALMGEMNVLVGGDVWADESEASCATILKFLCDGDKVKNGAIEELILFVIDILMGGVIVVGTIGIIIAGAQIMTARDNEEQLKKGKQRLMNVMIGVVLFLFLGVIMHLLLGQSGEEAVKKAKKDTETVSMEKVLVEGRRREC